MAPGDDGPRPARGRLARDLTSMAQRLRQITVQILGPGAGMGSGVVWGSDGLIVTNAHVLRRQGRHATVVLSSGHRFEGRLLARDAAADLAALGIDASALPTAELGDSEAVRVGELVIAVGNPLGLDGALTTGVVHAAGRGPARSPFIAADLALAPGNSGGPLADARGRVIGINAMVAGGLALAIPSRAVQRFLASLGDRAAAPS